MDSTDRRRPSATEDLAECCFNQRNQFDWSKASSSRRSIDWRDSGIVIDEDNHLFETLCNFDTRSSINSDCIFPSSSSTTSAGLQQAPTTCCPAQKIVFEQDDDGDTILHLAVVGFPLEKVRDLIKLCDLNAINNMMQTPLHVAVLANRPEMVQLLVDSKAQMNVHDRRGNTPLHLASQRGLIDIVEILLGAIANGLRPDMTVQQMLETRNFDGYTSLHLAANNDKQNIMELLVVKYGANLNYNDSKSGETIMHKAVRQFNVDLVAFILNLSNQQHCNGADFSGREPLDTIEILNEAYCRDADESTKLMKIKELIEAGIQSCIERRGCCSERQTNRDSLEMSDYSSSSSESGDSD